MSGAEVLKAAEGLVPTLQERAPDIESGRRLPADVLAALRDAGCFRILHPTSHGGVGADLPTALAMYEILARGDASTGWAVMIGSGAWLDLSKLPRTTFDQLFAQPDVIVAGAFNPTGSIEPDGDGYRVSGRWAFGSGCEHATWIYGNCGEGVVDGMPQLRIAVFDPADVEIEDTWHVAGLRGTGSHHFHVTDLHVPADRTLAPLADAPCLDEPVVRCPVPATLALAMAGVALGIARGALDDVVELSASRVPFLAPGTVAANPAFETDLARADTEVRAARSLLHELAEETWATAVAGDEATLEARARIRAAGTWAVERAEAAVDVAHRSGGSSALYLDSPLQRRLRDVQTLRQHMLFRADSLTTAGAVFAGVDPGVLLF